MQKETINTMRNNQFDIEKIFVDKLLATLKINACSIVDISNDGTITFIEELKDIIEKYNLNLNLDNLTDEKFYNIINSIDPLLAEREGNNLYIIMDYSLALLIIKSNDKLVSMKDMFIIGKELTKFMDKEHKVKVIKYENYK